MHCLGLFGPIMAPSLALDNPREEGRKEDVEMICNSAGNKNIVGGNRKEDLDKGQKGGRILKEISA